MKIVNMSAICALVFLIGGRVPLAAPGQEYTFRPGDPTQAKVWIQNTPLSVDVRNMPSLTLSPSTVVQTKAVSQPWAYRTIAVAAGRDVAAALVDAGAQGWETTGLQFPASDGIVVLLKRPL
jgi:hypothetical protein